MHEENVSAHKMLWWEEMLKNISVARTMTFEETKIRSDGTAEVTSLQIGQPRNCTHRHGIITQTNTSKFYLTWFSLKASVTDACITGLHHTGLMTSLFTSYQMVQPLSQAIEGWKAVWQKLWLWSKMADYTSGQCLLASLESPMDLPKWGASP